MPHCLICGNPLKSCLCPRCGFDLSLCVEQYPSLGPAKPGQQSMHSLRDKLYRELEALRVKAAAVPAAPAPKAPRVQKVPAPQPEKPSAPGKKPLSRLERDALFQTIYKQRFSTIWAALEQTAPAITNIADIRDADDETLKALAAYVKRRADPAK